MLLPKKMESLINEEPVESKPRIRRGLYNMSVHQVFPHTSFLYVLFRYINKLNNELISG